LRFHVVIPARYASTRLPGKPLLDIGGRPMVRHVVERACASRAESVTVATDDERIVKAVTGAAAQTRAVAMLTAAELPSGTDRAAAVAAARAWSDDTIVVNVQGDEPFVASALIDQVAQLLHERPDAALATLATPIDVPEQWGDPNVVKVVVRLDGLALYFSRAPIPWRRDAEGVSGHALVGPGGALRHVGLYAYRVSALRRLTQLAPTRLESLEKLEQLRALEHGMPIAVALCAEPPMPGVDTEADLQAARLHFARRAQRAGAER
jgi:3-deoxy-manno-octulosonate cytidylyltransferase (CMP-KDO synthetase)